MVTSNDVIHSWWVPSLGIKRDAIPGFIYESWARIDKPGIYRGQCAELCGIYHAFMPIVVQAVTEEDYKKWVAQNSPTAARIPGAPTTITPSATGVVVPTPAVTPPAVMTKAALMEQGEKVYNATCAICHKEDGSGMPPAFPAMKGGPIATGPVAAHINIVLNGKPGTAMQAFRDQLNAADIAAVITYERNAWGNDKAGKDAGGLVQPAEIVQAKK
jgi:cytochrome c oxidase subunit 2